MTAGSAPSGPRVFGVTGMHRSGTSFAARALDLLGVSLGDESALMPPGPDNTAGYWENQQIKEFDDELLSHLGGAWDFPPVLVPGWEQDPSLTPFADRARSIMAEAFGPGAGLDGPIAMKDPRISLLLPFWRSVLPITTTIILVRSPHEVARSLGVRRYSVGPDQAVVLWLRYLYAATANDPGHLLISHEDFFDDLDTTVDRIVAHLGLAAPDATTRAAVHEAFDPALRHHRVAPAATADPNPVRALAERVWNDGHPDLGVVADEIAEALAQGWLCGPLDADALTKARADVIRLKERVKKLNAATSPAS